MLTFYIKHKLTTNTKPQTTLNDVMKQNVFFTVAPEITGQLEFLIAIMQTQQTTIQNQQSQLKYLTEQMMGLQNAIDENEDLFRLG